MGNLIQPNFILSEDLKCASQRIEAHGRALSAAECGGSSEDFNE